MLLVEINQKNACYTIIGIFQKKVLSILIVASGLEIIAIINIKSADYRYIIWNISESDAIKR